MSIPAPAIPGFTVDTATAARLHEMAEGWPLGLQLALSFVAQARIPARRTFCVRGARPVARAPGVFSIGLRLYIGLDSCRDLAIQSRQDKPRE